MMPDRFANGDPANDNPAGTRAPADRNVVGATHGGDLRGIRDHLGYLKELGVTGIWMTPVYRNSLPGYSAYHGYHTVDFYAVEPRFGTMQDFRDLVDAAHRIGTQGRPGPGGQSQRSAASLGGRSAHANLVERPRPHVRSCATTSISRPSPTPTRVPSAANRRCTDGSPAAFPISTRPIR